MPAATNTSTNTDKTGYPTFYRADQLQKLQPINTNSRITVGNLLNSIELYSGQSVKTVDGIRIIIEATRGRVIFVKSNGKSVEPGYYVQTPQHFHAQWLDLVRVTTAGKLQTTKTLAEWEVQFLIGMVAGAGWKGLSLVIGVDLFEEAITGKKSSQTKNLVRTLQILAKYHSQLHEVAPTLAKVLVDAALVTFFKGQEQHLLHAMATDPKVAARAAGTIITQLGKQAVDGKLTATSIIWSLLSQLAIKASLTIPAAAGNTVEAFTSPTEPEQIVAKIEEVLATLNMVITPEKRVAIINEITDNPGRVSQIFIAMISELKQPIKEV